MSSNTLAKKNLSSIQVLKTLQALLEDDYSMPDLLKRLNGETTTPVFNNSIVSKYINTCRYCGIDIPKINNKYLIANMPFGIDLSNDDLSVIEELKDIAKNVTSERQNKIFDIFLSKLNRFSNKKIAKVDRKITNIIKEFFDKAIFEKRKIKLIFKSKISLDCIPLEIKEKGGKTEFHVISDGREIAINIDKLAGIEILEKKYNQYNSSNDSVIFVLKGALAKRYSLRENETLLDSTSDTLTVSNQGDDKLELLLRLMRYDVSCEVKSPAYYREDMKKMLELTLKNYEV